MCLFIIVGFFCLFYSIFRMSNIFINFKKKGVYGFVEMLIIIVMIVMQEFSFQFCGDGKIWDGLIVKVKVSDFVYYIIYLFQVFLLILIQVVFQILLDVFKYRGNDVSLFVNYGGYQKVKKRIKFGMVFFQFF